MSNVNKILSKFPNKIQMVAVKDMTPAPYNPRKELTPKDTEYKRIAASLEKFGLLENIVFNKRTGHIVGGNQRTKILKSMEATELPCYVVDLSLDDEMELNIFLNRATNIWDEVKVREVKTALVKAGRTETVAVLGLDQIAAADPKPVTDEEAPPTPGKAKSKAGVIYKLGAHRLFCGDSLVREDIDKRFLKKKVPDLVYTDPPWGVSLIDPKKGKGKLAGGGTFGGNHGKHSGKNRIEATEYAQVKGDDSTETARQFYELSVQMGHKQLIIWGGNYFSEFLPPTKGWICWDKLDGLTSTTNNYSQMELAWTNLRMTAKIVRHRWYGLLKASEKKDKRVHPNQKPIAVAIECFKLAKAGKLIYDPFAGSGSTLMACELTKRTCWAVEFEAAYCDVIRKRWWKHKNGSETGWVKATPELKK